MRGVFGVLSLLIVLGSVGFLAKKQLSATHPPVQVQVPGITTAEQAQLPVEQQVKQSVEAALQKARPIPDE
jgi:hypothetical protein